MPTLYERLGSSEGIQALVDDILAAHLDNPIINKRFIPILDDPERVKLAKQHLCYFLEAGSGGPQRYAGRGMAEVHRGMNITGEEYLAAVDDIMGAMDKHKLDDETKKDVLAIAYSLKSDIMRQ